MQINNIKQNTNFNAGFSRALRKTDITSLRKNKYGKAILDEIKKIHPYGEIKVEKSWYVLDEFNKKTDLFPLEYDTLRERYFSLDVISLKKLYENIKRIPEPNNKTFFEKTFAKIKNFFS